MSPLIEICSPINVFADAETGLFVEVMGVSSVLNSSTFGGSPLDFPSMVSPFKNYKGSVLNNGCKVLMLK
jgi:hypothetical protein